MIERARQAELAARRTPAAASPARRCTTAARRRAPTSSPVSASITGMPGLRMHALAEHAAVADPCALRHHATRLPIVASSPTITGAACGGSSTPPMPDATRQVHTLADLRARPDRRPGVDHGVGADARADVHVARHQDHARREVRAPPRRRPGHRRAPWPPRSRASAGSCRRTRTGRARSSPSSTSRNSSRIAYFSHSCTTTSPSTTSATRASPRSSRSIASCTAARASSLGITDAEVVAPLPERR